MNRKTVKSQKSHKGIGLSGLVAKKALTEEDKAIIKQVISHRIKYFDELLEEQIESILFGNKELKLSHETIKESVLFAKQIYFQG